MRIFISVLGILSLVSCDTGDGTKTETGTVTTDSGDAPDTGNPNSQVDRDGDGFTDDCDDNNPAVFPGAAEYCDGLDNDCNTIVDDDPVDDVLYFEDADADGFGNASESVWACDPPTGYVTNDLDCDDTDARFNPGAIETDCEDANDYNCDGSVGYTDADSDGFAACADCDDANPDVNDDAAEVCNEIDDDCDGDTDAEDPDLQDGTVYYGDSDGDGHGGQQYEALDCEAPAGFVENSEDCDDLEPLTYPSAAEICDEEDNDCDGDIDEGVGLTWYADVDGDGYGDATATVFACDAPQGYTANGNDCDDANAATNPSAYEICDGIDNNCDGNTDDASALNTTTFYADTDSDGYGDAANSVTACEAPSNHVENDSDCDDTQAATNPAADELCDGSDNDCDGSVDEASAVDASTWYADADNDTYGNAAISQTACTAPSGHVANSSDCDDTSSTAHPGATETCNGVDDNCDNSIDEGVLSTFYADVDNDGYGSPTVSQEACTAPVAYVSDNTDCNDVNASVRPGGTEVCDAANDDEDCDGFADDNDPEGATGTTLYYPDADSDGYGDSLDTGVAWCDPPSGIVNNNTDCDDTATGTDIHPGATEVCDSIDADCDGSLDDDAQDNCHTLAACTDPGTGHTCSCLSGYDGDGISSCDTDTFPGSELLDYTQKEQLNTWANSTGHVWTLCYRKSDDGGSSSTFHSQCDSYSTTFSIADLDSGMLIGGYSTTSWGSSSGYTGTSGDNFLFSLTRGYKIQHCTGQHSCDHSQYNHNGYGPTFGGGHDWHINGSLSGGYCNLGHNYGCQVGSYGSSACRTDFCGTNSSWAVNDLEVWGL